MNYVLVHSWVLKSHLSVSDDLREESSINYCTLMKHLTADQRGSGARCFSHSGALCWLNVSDGNNTGGGKYVSHSVEELLFLWPLGGFSGLKLWRPLYVKC